MTMEVYFGTGCAHLRPGAVRRMRPGADRRMSPGRSSTDEPWAQFELMSPGRNLTDEPAIFSTIGHSEMVSSNDSHVTCPKDSRKSMVILILYD